MRPNPLVELASAHKQARILQTAVSLGVFDAISDRPAAARTIARRIGLSSDGALRLLQALQAMRLVRQRGEVWTLSRSARRSLVRGSPRSLVHVIRWLGRNYSSFEDLPDALRQARPTRATRPTTMSNEERRALWIGAMHELGSSTDAARTLARALPLDGRRAFVDIGAGSGVYGAAVAEAHPALSVTLVDVAEITPFTRHFVEASPARDRIVVAEANIERDELARGHDAALLSHVLHLKREADALRIVCRVHRALEPGGVLFVRGLHLADRGPSSLEASIMSLTLALETAGRGFSISQVTAMLRRAGFSAPRVLDAKGLLSGEVIYARKPR